MAKLIVAPLRCIPLSHFMEASPLPPQPWLLPVTANCMGPTDAAVGVSTGAPPKAAGVGGPEGFNFFGVGCISSRTSHWTRPSKWT